MKAIPAAALPNQVTPIKAKALLDQGRIGRLICVRCRVGEHLPQVRPDYRNMVVLKEGGAYELTHEIDLACWFAGKPISQVKAIHGAFSDLGFTAPDVVEILINISKADSFFYCLFNGQLF